MSLTHGSPMTPASWGVRRMLFGYSSHSRWLSCARRWFAEYPHLYALHPTPYTGVPTICHVRGGGSPCLPCFRVNPCSSVGGTSPCHLLCFASGLAIFSPLSFRSRGCLVLADFPASKSLPLHLTHSPLHQKNHQKDISFAFFFDLI